MYPGSYTDLEIRDCKHSAVAISSGPYPYPYLHLHTTVEVPARQRDITRLYLLYTWKTRPDWPRPRLYPDGESPVIGRTRARRGAGRGRTSGAGRAWTFLPFIYRPRDTPASALASLTRFFALVSSSHEAAPASGSTRDTK